MYAFLRRKVRRPPWAARLGPLKLPLGRPTKGEPCAKTLTGGNKKLRAFEFGKRECLENITTPKAHHPTPFSRSSHAPGPPDGADPSVST